MDNFEASGDRLGASFKQLRRSASNIEKHVFYVVFLLGMLSWSHLAASWGDLGAVLRPLGAILRHLGASRGEVGAS